MKLKNEIYKNGFTIKSFALETGLSRWTIMAICQKKYKKVRGSSIFLIAKALGITYEECEKLVY